MNKRKTSRLSWVEAAWQPLLERVEKSRLRRGKAAAKQGDVLRLDVRDGAIVALVRSNSFAQGDCHVTLPLPADWRADLPQVATWLARNPQFLAASLAGVWSDAFLECLERANLHLFPDARRAEQIQWEAKCSCQDWEPFCRHMITVVYAMIADMEERPLRALAYVGLDVGGLLDHVHELSRMMFIEQITEWQEICQTYAVSAAAPMSQMAAEQQFQSEPEAGSFHPVTNEQQEIRRSRLQPIFDEAALRKLPQLYMACVSGASSGKSSLS